MKPDTPDNEQVSGDMNNKGPSVILNGGDTSDLPDMDDEVMGFMHTNVHRQLKKIANKGAWGKRRKQRLMDKDTKAYFDELIRGSALFGIMPDEDGQGDGEEEEEIGEENTATAPPSEEQDENREPPVDDAARTQLSRLLLAKKVAEAFMANKPGKEDDDDDDDDDDTDGGPTQNDNTKPQQQMNKNNNSGGGWDAPLMTAKENALAPDDYNRPVNPLAPVKLPINQSNEASTGTALEDIRSRLRKTKFDYNSDSRSRISDATPAPVDYRNVLKKKGKV